MGDIGTERREVEFEPLTEDPVPAPARRPDPRRLPPPRPTLTRTWSTGPAVADDVALVPGELRGYRQFSLKDDGLYPLVHTVCGPWDGQLQRAVCASGARHASPAPDCLCGLYGWYLPGSATVSSARSARWSRPAAAAFSVTGASVLRRHASRRWHCPRRSAGPRARHVHERCWPSATPRPGLPLDPADAEGLPAAGRQRPRG